MIAGADVSESISIFTLATSQHSHGDRYRDDFVAYTILLVPDEVSVCCYRFQSFWSILYSV